jgi:hypothetical protein
MATVGYPDPISAIDAVVACLRIPNFVVHTGSLNSGLTIPCCASGCQGDCPHGVLRVETGDTTPKDGLPVAMIMSGKCAAPLVQEIVVNYRECFPSNLGKAATPTAELTAAGLSVVMSWWAALQRLWACGTPTQQRLRFVRRSDSEPLGQCAGWTLVLECDLVNCLPTPVVAGGLSITVPPADLGVAPV